LKSLKLGESPNYTQVAQKYGCERSTLSRRHRGVQGTHATKTENERLLTSIQEKELIIYINGLTTKGLPLTKQIVRNFASEIAGKEAGKL